MASAPTFTSQAMDWIEMSPCYIFSYSTISAAHATTSLAFAIVVQSLRPDILPSERRYNGIVPVMALVTALVKCTPGMVALAARYSTPPAPSHLAVEIGVNAEGAAKMSDQPPQAPQTYPPQQPQQPSPPYYQPPAQQPSPPRASSNPFGAAFWHNMSTLKISVITFVSTVLLITVCVVPFLATGNLAALYQPRHIVFEVPLPSDATAMPTRTPQPLTGATLGGLPGSFLAKFGNPVVLWSFSQKRNWFRFKLANGTMAYLCYCGEATGRDGNFHLDDFRIAQPSGTTWSDQQGVGIARQFFPPDAQYVRDIIDPYVGLTHVYVSAALAATFPASEFRDYTTGGNSQLAPPGTFLITCGQPDPTRCEVTTGY